MTATMPREQQQETTINSRRNLLLLNIYKALGLEKITVEGGSAFLSCVVIRSYSTVDAHFIIHHLPPNFSLRCNTEIVNKLLF